MVVDLLQDFSTFFSSAQEHIQMMNSTKLEINIDFVPKKDWTAWNLAKRPGSRIPHCSFPHGIRPESLPLPRQKLQHGQ